MWCGSHSQMVGQICAYNGYLFAKIFTPSTLSILTIYPKVLLHSVLEQNYRNISSLLIYTCLIDDSRQFFNKYKIDGSYCFAMYRLPTEFQRHQLILSLSHRTRQVSSGVSIF
jgi:hypothetical protein